MANQGGTVRKESMTGHVTGHIIVHVTGHVVGHISGHVSGHILGHISHVTEISNHSHLNLTRATAERASPFHVQSAVLGKAIL